MKNIGLKILVTLISLCISSFGYAGTLSADVRCFSSPNNRIKLEFRMYSDSDIGWVSG
ncbi:hypothetical protein [Photobacterium nomapromontoriensis]|uniref:hypothetical protein n=1 Tax=Photobacterium nomapromontoriensis TaxID=2910237 RepID=UPI003D0CE98D